MEFMLQAVVVIFMLFLCALLFPEVDHDDLFDALDHAMTVADKGNEIRVLERKDFII